MFPYHLTHLALPTIHLKPQKETVLHSSFPLSPCRHSLPLLPESNLRHLECPHADRVPRGPPHDTLVRLTCGKSTNVPSEPTRHAYSDGTPVVEWQTTPTLSHLVLSRASTGIKSTTSGTLSCPDIGQSTTSGEPTCGRCSQPHPHTTNYCLVTGASHPFYCSYV